MKSTKSRLLSLEAELLQLNQRNGEKEEEMIKTKAEYIDRIQKLTAVLQVHNISIVSFYKSIYTFSLTRGDILELLLFQIK